MELLSPLEMKHLITSESQRHNIYHTFGPPESSWDPQKYQSQQYLVAQGLQFIQSLHRTINIDLYVFYKYKNIFSLSSNKLHCLLPENIHLVVINSTKITQQEASGTHKANVFYLLNILEAVGLLRLCFHSHLKHHSTAGFSLQAIVLLDFQLLTPFDGKSYNSYESF